MESNKKLKVEEPPKKGLGKIVAGHYNNLEEKGLDHRNLSRIVYMRNFNNWIKSILFNKYTEKIFDRTPDEHKMIGMDLGCGKGGDLFKWQKLRMRHLICTDIAQTSVEQCKERSENTKGAKFSFEFIVADFTKTRLKTHIKCPERRVDLVSCQFALHYCFETLPQVETLLRNVSEVLRKGGYFIGTIPDSYKIMSQLEKSGGSSFGNDVFRITFPANRSSSNPPLFGDKYNFFLEGVVDCPEFLVHFPTLVKLAKKYNLEFVSKDSFEDLYKEYINHRESKDLIFKMKALELYPSPNPGMAPPWHGKDSEYSHAETFMKAKNVQSVKTISKSEWEAACIYTSFGFKKIGDN